MKLEVPPGLPYICPPIFARKNIYVSYPARKCLQIICIGFDPAIHLVMGEGGKVRQLTDTATRDCAQIF